MKPHKHCELIHAYADGAEIEHLCIDGSWRDVKYPQFLPDGKYRIKPKTVKREGWINLYKVNYGVKPGIDVFDTEADARHMALSATIATVKVEWEEVE